MIDKTIGKRIRQCRKKKGLTIENLAEKAEITPTFLGEVERGNKLPSIHTFIKIVNALDVSFDYILSEKVTASKPIVVNALTKKIMNFNTYQLKMLEKMVDTIDSSKQLFKE